MSRQARINECTPWDEKKAPYGCPWHEIAVGQPFCRRYYFRINVREGTFNFHPDDAQPKFPEKCGLKTVTG